MKNLTYKISLLILGLFAAGLAANAQQIKGVVSDVNGDPLIGVSVFVDGTTLGVSTGVDGSYAIDIPDAKGKTLIFSMIGLAEKRVTIGNAVVIDIVLEEDANFLDETVVIGYATVKRRDLMGSVSSVDNKSLTQVPVASVTEALSGRMAGVQVTATEGDPDAEIKIRVRGTGSITQDSSPLYIVDGFPVESISDIPASDIQSIDVLKDAFSTAIYGSRGANGVVLVTTVSGQDGKISVSYNGYAGMKTMANRDAIQVMDAYDFVRTQYEVESIRDKVTETYEPMFGAFSDIDMYKGMKTNDWVDALFGNTGWNTNHNISVNGGSDKVKWAASYNFMKDNAIMTGSDYGRHNISLKTQFKPVKALALDFNLRYSNTTVRGSGSNSINDAGSTSGTSARLKHAVQYTPIPVSGATSDSDLAEDYGDNAPPLQSIKDNDKKRNRQNWTFNAGFTWKIIENLNLRIEGGLDSYNQKDNNFYGLTTYYVGNATYKNKPATFYTDINRQKLRNTNTLSYNFENVFGKGSKHAFDIMIGQETIFTKSSTFKTTIENFPEFFDAEMAWNFMASGTAMTSNNYYNPNDLLVSFFGRANYSYDDRYSISATVRSDASSKFTYGNQWGFFPSAALSWTISNEGFMENAKSWVDNLKLRYTYGTAGNNNIPSGVSTMLFAANASTWISQGGTYWSTTKVDGKTIMPNPDLTWETTISHNVGLDFSFFRTRMNGSIEAYSNDTRDLLIRFPVQGTGYDYQYRNMGNINNKGLEFTLNGVLVETKNVGITVGGNISYNINEVKSLGGLDMIEDQSMWASTEIGTDYLVQPGQPLGNMYGYQSAGMYGTEDFTFDSKSGKWVLVDGVADAKTVVGETYMRPGAPKFVDQLTEPVYATDENGEFILDSDGNKIVDHYVGDGVINEKDKVIIGNAIPKFTGGFYINANFYGFDLSANFNFVIGNQIYNANKIEFSHSRKYSRRNLLTSMSPEKRWTNIDWNTGELVNDPNMLESMNQGVTMWNPAIGNAIFSDWAVEDGSFLRLSTLTLGYTLPAKLTNKFHCSKLRVYVTGSNLFCLTEYSGYDPEVDTRRSTPLTPGVDYSAYPKSRGFVAGINITF
ncbi:MAG: TonB-dependent receptor [Bacteroidales bacterium]|nr:TonB-dependent receptor [Bacteroidales bacterium]